MSKAKTKSPKTSIVAFLLDRSGSMERGRDDTIGAFNAYLSELRKGSGISFTFLQFDSQSLDTIYKHEDVSKVADLTRDTFVPRGMTPLIDACYKTIKAVEEALTRRDDKPRVAICFQTDGQENCSREYTMAQLNDLIKAKTAEGWDFSFMGASIDAYAPALSMGISSVNTMSYDSFSPDATRAAFSARGMNTAMFASGISASTGYTDAQKRAGGDPTVKAKKPNPKKPDPVVSPIKIVDDIKL